MANRQFDYIKTKGQLGRPEDQGFFTKSRKDTIQIQESPTQVKKQTLSGDGGIYGSSVAAFGEYGVAKYGSPTRTTSAERVVSSNNTVYEKFTTSIFIDSSSDALYGSGSAYFSSGSALVSDYVYLGSNQISKATIITTQTGTALTLYLSNTGTANFESVTDSTEHSFAGAGTALHWKAEASGGTARLTDVKIIYE